MSDIEFRSTMDVELVQWVGSDAMVARTARVSTLRDKREVDEKADRGLIRRLIKDKHGSSLEHNSFTFYVSAPLFVFREFQRHRIASYNEASGRYSVMKPVFYVPSAGRDLVQVGKAMDYEFIPGDDAVHGAVVTELMRQARSAYDGYEDLLNAGVAREVARMALPLSLYSEMYVTMNARGLMNFLSLRTEDERASVPSHPQKEIQMVAVQMERLWAQKMPATYEAFNDFGRVCP